MKVSEIMTSYNIHAIRHVWEKVKTAVLTEAQEPLTGITFWHCSKLYHRSLFQNNTDIYIYILS